MKFLSKSHARLLLLLAGCFAVTYTGMAQNTIDFSKSHNLKALYDAGLRPWRFRPTEMDSLHLTHEQIRVIPPGMTPFTMNLETGTFPVRAENELSEAEFISEPMGLSQAAVKAREICQALGIPIAGLEEKASQLGTMGKRTPAPQYWNGRGERAGVRFSVTLDGLFGWDDTRGKLYVVFQFSQPGKSMKSLTEPIKPPPGYEHMSMERPETNPSKPFPDPAYSRENMLKRFEEAKATGTQVPLPPSTPVLIATPTPSPPNPTVVERLAPSVTRKWSWVVGIFALIVVVALALKRRAS